MSKSLNEQRNDLITRAEEIVNEAKDKGVALTDEQLKEIDDIKKTVEAIAKTLKIEEDVAGLEKKPDDTPTEEKKPVEEKPAEETEKRSVEANERAAFENYIRGAVNERSGELAKTSNGAVIPTTIAAQIIKRVYNLSPVLEKSTQYNVKGKLQIPFYDDETSKINVAYQDEFAPLSSSTGNFKSIELSGFLAGALSKVSLSLINNAQFDIVNFVVEEMAQSIARFIEHELLVGTDGKVEGLSKLTNKGFTVSQTAITADELISLASALPDVYQKDAIWIMSPATRIAIRTLKDNDGRYLLNDDVTSEFGSTLLGKPVYVSDSMHNLGEQGKFIAYYGDFKGLATKFSENVNVQVLREKYADEHAVGVIGWFEFDSKVQDNQRIIGLENA